MTHSLNVIFVAIDYSQREKRGKDRDSFVNPRVIRTGARARANANTENDEEEMIFDDDDDDAENLYYYLSYPQEQRVQKRRKRKKRKKERKKGYQP